MDKLVTVVIAVYNGEKYIKRSVESVLKQCYPNIEIIVVNDNSTDKTLEVLKEIKDKRLTVISHEQNKGGSGARNTGLRLAKGEYIALLDDDDEMIFNRIDKQVDFMNEGNFDIMFTDSYVVEGDKRKYSKLVSNDLFFDILSMNVSAYSGSTIMIRRKYLVDNDLYFDENYRRHQDIEFVSKWLRKGKYGILNEPLTMIYARSFRSGVKTKSRANVILENKERLLTDFKKDIENLSSPQKDYIYARQWLQMSRFFALEGDVRNTLKYLFMSLRYKFLFSKKLKVVPFETYFMIPIYLFTSLFKKNENNN